MFKNDEQIVVIKVNDTDLGIDESMSESNWDIWLDYVKDETLKNNRNPLDKVYWYVGEKHYVDALQKRCKNYCIPFISDVIYVDRSINPISASMIRENPIKYWNKIAFPFRKYFSTNILITGTASEGKTTLTRDISVYFGIPHVEEYGRDYMEYYCKEDPDLTVTDFTEFIIEQSKCIKSAIESQGNNGIIISDTDNLVTLMYAKAYVDDKNIDLTEEDYITLENLAKHVETDVKWDKIYLLPPKNEFVNDGVRYMNQSSIKERTKNYHILVKLLKQFGFWDKVEILDGDFLENFEVVKQYINKKHHE
jgi:NadR type nicotinamide-nucleotide adenylyltransferase